MLLNIICDRISLSAINNKDVNNKPWSPKQRTLRRFDGKKAIIEMKNYSLLKSVSKHYIMKFLSCGFVLSQCWQSLKFKSD